MKLSKTTVANFQQKQPYDTQMNIYNNPNKLDGLKWLEIKS